MAPNSIDLASFRESSPMDKGKKARKIIVNFRTTGSSFVAASACPLAVTDTESALYTATASTNSSRLHWRGSIAISLELPTHGQRLHESVAFAARCGPLRAAVQRDRFFSFCVSFFFGASSGLSSFFPACHLERVALLSCMVCLRHLLS